jgi:hypothetical protein
MAVPNTFATDSGFIPLADLDANFSYYDAALNIVGSNVTTLGAVTINTGTANGVAYLNGSKVLTAGSALVFDGTNLGIGTSSPGYKLDVSGQGRVTESGTGSGDGGFISNTGSANGNAGFLFQTNSTSRWNFTTQGTNGANLRIYNYTLGSTVATFDSSGNLGIGTSSPTNTITLATSNARLLIQPSTATNGAWTQFNNTGGNAYVGIDSSTGSLNSGYALNIYHAGAYPIIFSTSNAEKMRLDASGNLGLGVTPSAWVSNRCVLQIGGPAAALALNGTAAISEIFANAYRNTSGTYIYAATGAASYVDFNNSSAGGWAWSIAPSGTAGNPITFTQAMTLDASGKLQLNATSTAGGYFTLNTLAQAGLDIYRSDTTANYNGIRFRNTTNTATNASIGWDSLGLRLDGDAGLMVFSTSGTERARIDSSGNLIQSAPTTPPSLSTNGTMVFNLTSNTNLRVSVRGSDGVTRTANLTLA